MNMNILSIRRANYAIGNVKISNPQREIFSGPHRYDLRNIVFRIAYPHYNYHISGNGENHILIWGLPH